MKRIGKTDQGGILLEMTATDVQRLQQACEALGQLFDEVDGPAVVVADESHRTFEATGTRLPDGSIKVKTIKPVATKTRKSDEGKKACSVCGKMFVPPRSDSTCCSASCRGKAYRAAKVGGVKPVSVAKCLSCGRAFEPKRKDQTCCSVACRKKAPKSNNPAPAESAKSGATKSAGASPFRSCEFCGVRFIPKRKDSRLCSRACTDKEFRAKNLAKQAKPVIAPAAAPVVKSPSPEADKKSRLEILRKIVKKDAYVPPSDFGSARADYSSVEEFAQADREARRG